MTKPTAWISHERSAYHCIREAFEAAATLFSARASLASGAQTLSVAQASKEVALVKFAQRRRISFAQNDQQLKRAARGYQDINRVAMNILRPGGVLATFSCSGLVSPDLFQKIIFSASLEAEREVQIVEKLSQASDHPILVTLPESEYLKGFVCRVI